MCYLFILDTRLEPRASHHRTWLSPNHTCQFPAMQTLSNGSSQRNACGQINQDTPRPCLLRGCLGKVVRAAVLHWRTPHDCSTNRGRRRESKWIAEVIDLSLLSTYRAVRTRLVLTESGDKYRETSSSSAWHTLERLAPYHGSGEM